LTRSIDWVYELYINITSEALLMVYPLFKAENVNFIF
jgi:hypothetical protein